MTFVKKVMMGAGTVMGQVGRGLALCFVLTLATGGGSTTWAAVNSWTNSGAGDGLWGTGANWALGAAPSSTDDKVYITNAVSKTVTINASTSAGNLTVSNLVIEAPSGATNTLLLSSNTTPLTCLAVSLGQSFVLGYNANQAGAIMVDGGSLVTTNATADAWPWVGRLGKGVVTVLSGTWLGNKLVLGEYNTGNGALNLSGGTNVFSSNVTVGDQGMGTISMNGGRFVATNAPGSLLFSVGAQAGSTGYMTVSNGTMMVDDFRLGYAGSGTGVVTLAGGRVEGKALVVGYIGNGTLNLTGGTNVFTGATHSIGGAAGGIGNVLMTGGLLLTTNSSDVQFGLNGGRGAMTVSNGIWMAQNIILGKSAASSSGNSLTIRGGQVFSMGVNCNLAVGTATCSNNVLLVTDGGLMEFRQLLFGAAAGNVVSNSGGIYQFASGGFPFITLSAGSISINGGTISYRNATAVDVKANWTGTELPKMIWTGTNAFRLNNSTNATTPSQSYTFAANLGPTNYARLELVNGTTCYGGGSPTIGSGGSILFSNTMARVNGSLVVNNTGTVSVVDSTITVTGACTIAEYTTINWASNTLATVINVGGVLSLPTNATFTLSSPIGRNDTLTLFTATGGITGGSPANWTMTPPTHRLTVVNNTLVIRPRASGFILEIE